jgi:hypothetical protein
MNVSSIDGLGTSQAQTTGSFADASVREPGAAVSGN